MAALTPPSSSHGEPRYQAPPNGNVPPDAHPVSPVLSPPPDWPLRQPAARPPLRDADPWIHRDKLAKIESEELQAAGIVVPRTRPKRCEHSQSRLARDSADMAGRPRNNSTGPDQALDPWDLRTPEEIDEAAAAAAYFVNGAKGGSRIPVAKTSPAPIPLDCLERGSHAVRRPDAQDAPAKPRSRSASLSVSDQASSGPRRSVTEGSPRKNTRKTSAPKTQSGPSRDSSVQPPTRHGDGRSPPGGDPPWMLNSYRPDPRLPPDQQLLPTVARRLQQEKWEREGKFGDAYDHEFRPLNDHELRPPAKSGAAGSDGDGGTDDDGGDDNDNDADADADADRRPDPEWPLKPKSPTVRQGSYSTMPKISDKPPVSVARPRTPVPPVKAPDAPVRVPDAPEKGCGCCVVM